MPDSTPAITITANITSDDQPTLVTLINAAYKVGETGIFVDTKNEPFNRVNAEDVTQWADAGQLLVARTGDEAGRIIGCVKVVPNVDESVGEWGVLAVATEERGKGFGSQLIDAAEKALQVAGCQTAQVQLMAPIMWIHEHKERLRVHYTEKRGYALKTGDFDTSTSIFDEGALLFGRFTLATDVGFTIYTHALDTPAI